jgi:hypothetical protein
MFRWMSGNSSRKARIVLVASQPKSGSTFFCTALANITGFHGSVLVPDWNRREQEIDAALIEKYKCSAHCGYIAHNHVRNSEATAKLVQRFDFEPIVMLRNLFDVVASLRDHIRKESIDMSMAFITEQQRDLPDDELDYVIARLILPWYMNFYISWRNHRSAWVLAYEQMIVDPAQTLLDACTALRLGNYTREQAEAAVSSARGASTRLNVGKAGRGKQITPAVRGAILELLSLYPEAKDDEYIRSMTVIEAPKQ